LQRWRRRSRPQEEQISLLDRLLATLKLDKSENVLQDAAKLIEKIGAEARVVYERLLEKELVKRVPDERQRKAVQALVFSAEMQTQIQDASEEEASKLVSEQVAKAFNDDESVKFVVEQTAPPVVRRREEIQNGSKQDLGEYVVEETRKVS
jgi:aspartate/glutamate racemase